jgi:transcriptional regulator with XRE-family HTH domain
MRCENLLQLLGTRIRTIRKKLGITQERLAELADLHTTHVSEIERGKVGSSICVYDAIAAAFDMTLSELVNIPGIPGGMGPAVDAGIIALLQQVGNLDKKQQKVFLETAKGILTGIQEI